MQRCSPRRVSNFAGWIYSILSSVLVLLSFYRNEFHRCFKQYPQRSIADKLMVGSAHKLAAYREERRARRTAKVKVPLVNAQWETLPCGIWCKAVRVRGCGLRSCHVSAGIGDAPGRPVMPKRTTRKVRWFSLRFIAPRRFRRRSIWRILSVASLVTAVSCVKGAIHTIASTRTYRKRRTGKFLTRPITPEWT
jgi:hypothetical protein